MVRGQSEAAVQLGRYDIDSITTGYTIYCGYTISTYDQTYF